MAVANEKESSSKTVLITGGAGSLGSYLIPRFLKETTWNILVLDYAERDMFFLAKQYASESRVQVVIANLLDAGIEKWVQKSHYIVHLAASKYVSLGEENPDYVVQNNILGTQHLLDLCQRHQVEHFLFLSTDKAVESPSVYGASKLIGEKMTLSDYLHTTRFPESKRSVIRSGNFFGSKGSIIHIFQQLIAQKKFPLPITDPNMARFFVSYEQISQLILLVLQKALGGELFIPQMISTQLGTLVQALFAEYEKEYTGPKIGEKISELLVTEEEISRLYPKDEMKAYVILPQNKHLQEAYLQHWDLNPHQDRFAMAQFDAKTQACSLDEFRRFLEQENLLF